MKRLSHETTDHSVDWSIAWWGTDKWFDTDERKWHEDHWFCNGVDPTIWLHRVTTAA